MACESSSTNFLECQHNPTENCGHTENVLLKCRPSEYGTLIDKTRPKKILNLLIMFGRFVTSRLMIFVLNFLRLFGSQITKRHRQYCLYSDICPKPRYWTMSN